MTSVSFLGGGGNGAPSRIRRFAGPLVQSIMGMGYLVDEDLLTT